MIEQEQQTGGTKKSYFKPIPVDTELEKMNRNTLKYRHKLRQRACCQCTNLATQMLIISEPYQLEGCKKIEKYCDSCASALGLKEQQQQQQQQQNQPTSTSGM